MKNFYLMLCLYLLSTTALHSQNWQWVNAETDVKILKDQNNDLYIFANTANGVSIKKRDGNGNVLWTKSITGGVTISAYKTDPANNLVILGNIASAATIDNTALAPNGQTSFFILKLSPLAVVLNAKVYGGATETAANDLFINANGEYLVGGRFKDDFSMNGTVISKSDTLVNFFMLKTDANQNVLWWETNAYTTGGWAEVNELVETNSGLVYVIYTFYGLIDYKGYQYSSDGTYLVLLDHSRNITWSKFLYYPGFFDYYNDLQVNNGDTAYVKDAYTGHSGGPNSASIVLFTPAGVTAAKDYSTAGELGYAVANGKVYYAVIQNDQNGYSYGKIGVLNSDLSNLYADSAARPFGFYREVEVINSSGLYISGFDGNTGNFAGKYDLGLTTSVAEFVSARAGIYPSPTSGRVFISSIGPVDAIKIYNLQGMQQACNVHSNEIDLTNLPAGVYFVQISSGNAQTRQRVVRE